MRRRALLVGLVAVVLAASGVTTPAHAANTATVSSVAFTFVPPVVSIAEGDHLVFDNRDVAPHTLTSTDGKFDSGNVSAGASGPVNGVETLAPGSYQFVCLLHPWMRGVLNVGTGASLPSAPALPGLPALQAVGIAPTPTSITTYNGSLYVASYATGAVSKLAILPGGLLGPAQPYASGFTNPLGIVFDDATGVLFVADSHAKDGATVGRVWKVDAGGATPPSVFVDDLPNGRHNTNGMAVHNGQLFITNGNSTDDGTPVTDEAPLSGTLLSVPLTGGTPTVVARGMRNIYDVAFRAGTDEAWLPMNGPDALDPWGEDLLLKVDTAGPAVDFGFPGCVYSSTRTPSPDQNRAVADTDVCDGTQKPPEALLGLHVSADGLTFDVNGDYVYIAEFGNFFGSNVVGHRVVRLPVDDLGRVTGEPKDVVVGGAPLDVTATADGIYVADFATGQITLVKPLD